MNQLFFAVLCMAAFAAAQETTDANKEIYATTTAPVATTEANKEIGQTTTAPAITTEANKESGETTSNTAETTSNTCPMTGANIVQFKFAFDTFSPASLTVELTATILARAATVAVVNPLCINYVGNGADPFNFMMFEVSSVPDNALETMTYAIGSADLSALATTLSSSVSIADVGVNPNAENGKDKETYVDPTTAPPAPTTTTTGFNYYALIPVLMDNINTETGTINSAFLTQIAAGCAVDSNFCYAVMNYMATTIAYLSVQDSSNKEGYAAVAGASAASSSAAKIGFIAGGAVAFVALIALVATKYRNARRAEVLPTTA